MNNKTRIAAACIVLQLGFTASAATLQSETLAAWDAYLSAANAKMQARLAPGAKFMWLDEEPNRAEQIRTKGPYIKPISPQIPMRVPSGLIHDWLGVGFVPSATINDILRILRDYGHYKDVYRPGCVESTFLSTDGVKDFFSMRLVNRSVVAKTALDTEGEATYIRVDEHHMYSISNTTHIREIEKFGSAEQQTLAEDHGMGLIWRLSSITRLEERDGGVYAELEAIALSRDIPAAFRLFVTPIVRRVSKDSLATSLHQTKVAIDAGMAHSTESPVK